VTQPMAGGQPSGSLLPGEIVHVQSLRRRADEAKHVWAVFTVFTAALLALSSEVAGRHRGCVDSRFGSGHAQLEGWTVAVRRPAIKFEARRHVL
jgi:hypothetical protein